MLARSKLLLKIKRARDRFAALSIVLARRTGKRRCERALVGVARSTPQQCSAQLARPLQDMERL